jgi:Flp pilus assembly protein CpaB
MRSARATSRGVSPLSVFLIVVTTLVVGGFGLVGTLWGMGVVDLPFLRKEVGLPPGTIMVPASGQRIPAYAKVTREHLFNPQLGRLSYIPMLEESLPEGVLTDTSKILGRVLDHEKPAGYVFTERDFLPAGTRSGLPAGIPPGMRAVTLQADNISGIFGMKAGDHVDLLATVPIDAPRGGGGGSRDGLGGLVAQARAANIQRRATVRVLAQDAVLVTPVTSRNKPITSSSLTQGTQVRTVPVQEVVIAVSPQEVAPLTEALATGVDITCVARTGLPTEPHKEVDTPGHDPLSEVRVIESIVGKRREAVVFTSSGRQVIAEPAAESAQASGVAGAAPSKDVQRTAAARP